jgi:hypothetical protein
MPGGNVPECVALPAPSYLPLCNHNAAMGWPFVGDE